MAGAPAGRGGEMHPVFPSCFPSPLFPSLLPLFLFSLVSRCTPSTTLLLPPSYPAVSSPCLAFPQSCCSVRHCMIAILTTHPHGVLLPPCLSPLSHSQHTSRLHLDARLDPHGVQGCWQHHLKRTLSLRSTPPLPPTPPPFLMSVRTRCCSCCALP